MSYFSGVVERVERLNLPIPKGLHKFLGVGLVGLITHTGVFTLLYKINADPVIAAIGRLIGDGWLFHMIQAMNAQHSFRLADRTDHRHQHHLDAEPEVHLRQDRPQGPPRSIPLRDRHHCFANHSLPGLPWPS